MKYFLYGHNGSGNHGCEAIVRSTYKVLNQYDKDINIILATGNIEEDKKYGINKIVNIVHEKNKVPKFYFSYIKAYLALKILKKDRLSEELSYRKTFNSVSKNVISLSIGGDNYCYPGYQRFMMMRDMLTRRNAKTVLWGCSIEPNKIDEEMKIDLKHYDLIVSRESLTYNALKKIDANVYLYPDPAFQLDKIDLPLPEHFIENNTVGINVSPLIMSCESSDGITRENYIQLIDYILNQTDMNIALIPHVMWENNDDRKPLKELYDMFKDTNRVCLIDDHNCMELKGYISRCRFFVGARTHATIAAYSTCVPTLVVGYSVKAKGIAKDIFGTYDDYVLPVQSLKEKDDLTKSFKWLIENENDIKNHLNDFIPGYKEKALEADKKLKEIFGE